MSASRLSHRVLVAVYETLFVMNDVLIVGAGPTGLTLAIALARQGVVPRIIDAQPEPVAESRAMAVQARTLEFYRQYGFAHDAVQLGVVMHRVHMHVNGEQVTELSLEQMGQGISAYPYLLVLAQDIHERLLIEQLATLGVRVERPCRLVDLQERDEGVHAIVDRDGNEETLVCRYLVGCDGGGSATRQALEIGFDGGTSEGLFYVADVDVDSPLKGVRIGFGDRAFALGMPVRTTGTHRLIGIVPPELDDGRTLTFDDVYPVSATLLKVSARKTHWFSTYRVHHRVAQSFRRGRCFIAGDAGHVHSPVGGQGMNTGIGDAMNLAWKLVAVVKGHAPARLLETYEEERLPFAQELIATTDRAFRQIIDDGVLARLTRTVAVPHLMKIITGFEAGQNAVFRAVSQTRIAYRDSELSRGPGALRGARLPWIQSIDNHESLIPGWQAHLYGANDEMAAVAHRHGIPLQTFEWNEAMDEHSLKRGKLMWIRPDGYIGMVSDDPDELDAYAQSWGVSSGPTRSGG